MANIPPSSNDDPAWYKKQTPDFRGPIERSRLDGGKENKHVTKCDEAYF